jgi:uncharacterized membrane protein YphA (DoxX/SURF4 family)
VLVDGVELACRVMLAVVLGFAAASKLRGRRAFRDFVESLSALGVPARAPLAHAVVAAEISAIVLLVLVPSAGFPLAMALVVGFTVVVARAIRSGVRVACRCFGASQTALGPAHLVRNLLLLLVAVAGTAAWLHGDGGPLAFDTAAAACGAGIIGGAAVARWDDLAALVWPRSTAPNRRRSGANLP